MKAVFFTEHGGLSVLRYGDAPEPTAGPGEVVARAQARMEGRERMGKIAIAVNH